MKPVEQLKQQLQRIDGKDYASYQSIKGSWIFPFFELYIDRIPKDPYAPPFTGVYRARVPRDKASFPDNATANNIRKIALRDYLARQFHSECLTINKGKRGTGNSGIITIAKPGQSVLKRTSIVIDDNFIEARFFIGLPASGRKIQAKTAENMLCEELPQIIQASLFATSLDIEALNRHLEIVEDTESLRNKLNSSGLVAFIANGAVLPRASGIDDGPMETSNVVQFKSPESLQVSFDLPNAGSITGMGIPKGVTLIVGGGYHGKSTLLQTLALGIYNHIPDDGREYCVSLPSAVKVRAASGRNVISTDISAFINDIPFGKSTSSFSTTNASGSTSQAAFIAEAIEIGARLILMDEDTCATNFMIRDKCMQELVAKKNEPITPFIDRVRQLFEEHEISTMLVAGGSGDYIGVADCVIQMTEFEPDEITERAHAIYKRFTIGREKECGESFTLPRPRFPIGEGFDPRNRYGRLRITASEPQQLIFGPTRIDLSDVEQLVETAQTKAIGRTIQHAKQYMDGKTNLRQITEQAIEDIQNEGLDVLDPNLTGDLAEFRSLEFAAALNRMRGIDVKQDS